MRLAFVSSCEHLYFSNVRFRQVPPPAQVVGGDARAVVPVLPGHYGQQLGVVRVLREGLGGVVHDGGVVVLLAVRGGPTVFFGDNLCN